MNFDHLSLNELFGFKQDHVIPFICIDNPLCYVLKAQEKMRATTRNLSSSAWEMSELKSLQQQFVNTAESLEVMFKKLQTWEIVLTNEFATLYKAKSKAEADMLMAQHKLVLLQKERKELRRA
jgi:hypothetical protein